MLSLVMVVAWAASLRWCLRYDFGKGGSHQLWGFQPAILMLMLNDGCIEIRRYFHGTTISVIPGWHTYATNITSPLHLPSYSLIPSWGSFPPSPQYAPPAEGLRGPGYWILILPLWIPFLVIVAPTALLCWLDHRRIPPGHCQHCGYDLTGNTSGTRPECGTAVPGREASIPPRDGMK